MATAAESSALRLETPGDDGAGTSSQTPSAVRGQDAFSFPFPPYDIQLQLMRAIFRAVEDRKIGIFESPTGTGKSLSLICSAFTWLELNERRSENIFTASRASTSADLGGDPDWVVEHDLKRQREVLMAHEDELKERIRRVRQRDADLIREQRLAGKPPRPKKARRGSDDEESDSGFIASDFDSADEGAGPRKASRSVKATARDSDDDNLSPAVRALMAQLDATRGATSNSIEEEEPETTPKIFYASRTHSQLSQFVSELRKTRFGRDLQVTDATGQAADANDSIRAISLGSRKQMCINESVRKLGARAGGEAMNERCRELAKGAGAAKTRCDFLPSAREPAGKAKLLDFRDRALATVRDIEDLVQLGKDQALCPYYAARSSARHAQLITLPYNLLLHQDARESLDVSLKDSIVIIDEAHNLIDTILATHTVVATLTQIIQAGAQIDVYLVRFRDKLKGSNEVHLRQFRSILKGLETFCSKWADDKGRGIQAKGAKELQEILTASQVVEQMGGSLDQINLISLERWLKASQIARKVSGYADKLAAKDAEGDFIAPSSRSISSSAITAMHTLESFILSLGHRSSDGRVLLSSPAKQSNKRPAEAINFNSAAQSRNGTSKMSSKLPPTPASQPSEVPTVTLKYQLLNPANAFKTIVDEARSVILAGGTMEPVSDFFSQLLPAVPSDRFSTISCSHVIPAENLMVSVISTGPRQIPFELKFESRNDNNLLDDLGNAIINICNLVPHGVVVFVPSYAFLDTLLARWREGGALKRLEAKKKVFLEPKLASEVEVILRDYSAAIHSPEGEAKPGGVLLAVVGAKLSEGINFADKLARAVIMVGMPFANSSSPELAERMRYVREVAKKAPKVSGKAVDAGNELYTNLCMKAVNQSMGRAIRHKDDYAALIFLDRRYARTDIRDRLPGWIRGSVQVPDKFGGTISLLARFFHDKANRKR